MSRAESRLIILMEADWPANPVLKQLAARFRPVRLDATTSERLLSQKLLQADAPNTAIIGARRSVWNSTAPEVPLHESFVQELMAGLLTGPQTAEFRRQFSRDLAYRSAYSGKLTYSEIETATEVAFEKVPPLPTGGRGRA